jgi:hypothetical protein
VAASIALLFLVAVAVAPRRFLHKASGRVMPGECCDAPVAVPRLCRRRRCDVAALAHTSLRRRCESMRRTQRGVAVTSLAAELRTVPCGHAVCASCCCAGACRGIAVSAPPAVGAKRQRALPHTTNSLIPASQPLRVK